MADDVNPGAQPISQESLLQVATPNWMRDGLGVRGNPIPSDQGNSSPNWRGSSSPSPESQQFDFGTSSSTPLPVSAATVPSAYSTKQLPFQVTLQDSGSSSSPNYQAGVNYYSQLTKSLKPNDTQSITGLFSSATPDDTDGGWFSVSAGDLIWLDISVTNGSVDGAQINYGPDGSAFDTSADAWSSLAYVEDDGGDPPKQTAARILIAEIEDGGKVIQYLNTNLVMRSVCIAGRAALYPLAG